MQKMVKLRIITVTKEKSDAKETVSQFWWNNV